ncbi:hypothetical protein PEC301937_03370 [Pectobacterium carotovorum subsp. carotovorum]|nr:hypothetical protein PEC301937_03370 [Pectobacterium carotovorum subsp. carotovorum]
MYYAIGNIHGITFVAIQEPAPSSLTFSQTQAFFKTSTKVKNPVLVRIFQSVLPMSQPSRTRRLPVSCCSWLTGFHAYQYQST